MGCTTGLSQKGMLTTKNVSAYYVDANLNHGDRAIESVADAAKPRIIGTFPMPNHIGNYEEIYSVALVLEMAQERHFDL